MSGDRLSSLRFCHGFPQFPQTNATVKPIKIFSPIYNLHVTALFIAVCLKSRQHKALISKQYVRFEVSAAAIVKVTVL